ncbi:hypothetical protein [Streptomyces atratus]|uniref:Uncharacterized protein n=1 Tax=Streptomyces atratus TaxID=1893 RepID=A0A2Z5J8G8_STRAR|nr:hypothetical protein [Streptomyces atratus]AXE76513.1 hypothetical protein C5746_05740 [Streptomyces atratus]
MTKVVQAIADRLVERLVPGATAHAVYCWEAGSQCVPGSCAGKPNYTHYRMNCSDGSWYWRYGHCGC